MTRPAYHVQVGERYGLLTVTEIGLRAEANASQSSRGQQGPRAAWTLCDCGQTRLAEVGRLVVGKTRSCGQCTADGAPRRSGPGRQPKVIDTTPFEAVMAEALVAYTLDSGMLERMLWSAQNIMRKRRAWNLRAELKENEARAGAECEASELRSCVVTSPCSTGSCPWATGDFALLTDVPSLPSKGSSTNRATRPQPRPDHVPGLVYSIEAALIPLVELRTRLGTLEGVTPQEQRAEIEAYRAREAAREQQRAPADFDSVVTG